MNIFKKIYAEIFHLCGANVNDITFLISNCTGSLVVYRKVIKIYMLTCIMQASYIISPRSYFVNYSIFYVDYQAYKQRQLCFFLQISTPFISFSHHITLARTSCMIFKRNGDRKHLFLVPDLCGKAFGFLPLRVMSVIL